MEVVVVIRRNCFSGLFESPSFSFQHVEGRNSFLAASCNCCVSCSLSCNASTARADASFAASLSTITYATFCVQACNSLQPAEHAPKTFVTASRRCSSFLV